MLSPAGGAPDVDDQWFRSRLVRKVVVVLSAATLGFLERIPPSRSCCFDAPERPARARRQGWRRRRQACLLRQKAWPDNGRARRCRLVAGSTQPHRNAPAFWSVRSGAAGVCAYPSLRSTADEGGPQDITVLAGPVSVGAEPAHAPYVEFPSPMLSGSGGHGVLRAPEGESAPA
jgi:hypothetical protein